MPTYQIKMLPHKGQIFTIERTDTCLGQLWRRLAKEFPNTQVLKIQEVFDVATDVGLTRALA